METLFSKNAVGLYVQVWEERQAGKPLSGNAALISDAMGAHPEFDPYWTQGEAAFHPQEIDGYVVNPLIHIGLHAVIEGQLRDQDPLECIAALKALLQSGLPRHEAIHKLAALWGNLYFQSVRRGGALDEGAYVTELTGLIPAEG